MKRIVPLIVGIALLAWTGSAGATVVFSGAAGNLAASASFTLTGTTLTVVLTNTSVFDALVPVDILTGIFFDVPGFPPATLTPFSAAVTAGSTVFYGGTDPGGVVGGEWAYAQPLAGAPGNAFLGIASAGFGLFGPADLFPGNDLQPPASPDGLQYGITSAGDNLATGNAAVTGANALIQNSVTFTLTASIPFNESDIGNVSFQYGTALNEPNVPGIPEPATLLALGTGLLSLGAVRRFRRRS